MQLNPDIGDITQLLQNSDSGDLDEVLNLTYNELKKIARSFFSGQENAHTIQPTVLVHEAFMKLQNKKGLDFQSRGHFYAFLGTIMRHVLVDYIRKKKAEKRGSGYSEVTMVTGLGSTPSKWDILDVDRSLNRLEKKNARRARVVELKFFAGATNQEIADVLEVSLATIERDWALARAWLHKDLT